MELPERRIYTVSELTEQIRDVLERTYPSVWVQGEVSNFRAAPSGHHYFTLKDDFAQIRCVMFKMQNRFLKFKVEDGLDVIAWGRLSVYSVRGEYQLILDTMEPMGLGSLMLAFEQLKAKLAAEGLFDSDRKKPIPPFPRTIGLVTSSRGAAVRDMIRIIRRRFPAMNILVSPTAVQGDRAPDEIVASLQRLCMAGGVDAIVVGRGGGSVEDLWAFNDERVVRAVAHCPLPIVSAVGHETDVTLTDFAADLRASTPSAAAELIVPDARELTDTILHYAARLRNTIRHRLTRGRDTVSETLRRLFDPRRQIQERRMRMDELTLRLGNAMRRRMTSHRQEASIVADRLKPEHQLRAVATARQECKILHDRLSTAMCAMVKDRRSMAETLGVKLESLSPLSVLSRGYSITFRPETGEVLTDARQAQAGESVRVRLHKGELSCQVTERHTQPEGKRER